MGRLWIELEYAPRRVRCRHCGGVHVEVVPWAAHGSAFTYEFEELVAYLAQVTDKTKVTKLMGISWSTVGSIVEGLNNRIRMIAHRAFGFHSHAALSAR